MLSTSSPDENRVADAAGGGEAGPELRPCRGEGSTGRIDGVGRRGDRRAVGCGVHRLLAPGRQPRGQVGRLQLIRFQPDRADERSAAPNRGRPLPG